MCAAMASSTDLFAGPSSLHAGGIDSSNRPAQLIDFGATDLIPSPEATLEDQEPPTKKRRQRKVCQPHSLRVLDQIADWPAARVSLLQP